MQQILLSGFYFHSRECFLKIDQLYVSEKIRSIICKLIKWFKRSPKTIIIIILFSIILQITGGFLTYMALIYIVEDDKNIQEIESYALLGSGYDVCTFGDSKEFDAEMKKVLPDLILLDIMLPGEDGLSILKRLRADKHTKDLPIIMVTAKSSEIDTVKGLDQGADDYITKPFGVMELMSRVKAILRRIKPMSDDVVLKYKNILLDQERRICLVDEKNVELTFKEYELLRLFLSNIGIVLTRDMIMGTVWDSEFVGETRTIDMHIKTLRKKLGDAGSLIVTVRNVGYKLE